VEGIIPGQALAIRHCTILDAFTQTSPVHSNSTSATVQGMEVSRCLLAGGGFAVYGGNTSSFASRTDTGLGGTTNASATVTDTGALASDAGATITCTTAGVIPAFTTVLTATAGVGYTLSNAAVGTGSGRTFVLHFAGGNVVSNTRFSKMFYSLSGVFGTHADFDNAIASNVNGWTGNVYHETDGRVLFTDP
jgi:hypothetical protein